MFQVRVPSKNISFRVNVNHILHISNDGWYGEITIARYLELSSYSKEDIRLEKVTFTENSPGIIRREFLEFSVKEVEEDDFYGFTLDNNHLYIDENRIVQHNCGKSFMISSIAKEFGGPVLVLQPSQELLEQNIEKLFILGGEASIYSASLNSKNISKLTYATLGSVKVAVDQLKEMGVKTVLIDECHATFSPDENSQFSIFMKKLAPTKVIGLTATPFRLKSSMEGSELKLLTRMRPNYFKHFISIIQIQEIIESGYWSRIDYERHQFNESGLEINTSGSDYSEDSIREAIKVQGINNNIYLRIKQLLREGMPSILVFVDSVENAETMAKSIPGAACVHGKTNKKDRSKIIQGFKRGEIRVLVNVGVLTTGFDYPDLRCIIMGRPTMSLALYYQIIGRGTRISPATKKEACLYIDYCNNVDRFGRIENLQLEEVPGWGYGIFNNNLLLTNTPIAGLRKTKEDILRKLHGKIENVDKIWFGAHNGKAIEDLPIPYIKFILFETGWDFGSPKMKSLQLKLKAVLDKQEQRSLF
jgi:DNA repair protein RadD